MKTRSRVFAEYALRDTGKPMGIAEYQLGKALPKRLEASLPSVQQIEAELAESKVTPKAVEKRVNKKRTKRKPR